MERSEEVKQALLSFYEALAQGDDAAMEQLCTHQEGVMLFGTDPHERWTDHATILRAFHIQVQEMGGGLPIRASHPQAFAEGSVGWADDQPMFDAGEGQQFPMRFTVVFHQEGGAWKMVQGHLSIGVSNQDSFGQDLTP